MANRTLNQFQLTYEKDSVTIYATINIGAAGAVSAYAGGGIQLVTKQATAGQYTITFTNQFSKFLSLRSDSVNATADGIANIQLLQAPATLQADVRSTRQLTIQCLDYAGAAANLASGAQIMLVAVFRNSSVNATT